MAPAGHGYVRPWRHSTLDRIAMPRAVASDCELASSPPPMSTGFCAYCVPRTLNPGGGGVWDNRGQGGRVSGGPKLTADRTIFEIRMRL